MDLTSHENDYDYDYDDDDDDDDEIPTNWGSWETLTMKTMSSTTHQTSTYYDSIVYRIHKV